MQPWMEQDPAWLDGHQRPRGAGTWFGWTSTQFLGPQAQCAGLCSLLSCFGPGHQGQTLTESEESFLPAGCGLLGLVGTESGKVSPAPSGTAGAELEQTKPRLHGKTRRAH